MDIVLYLAVLVGRSVLRFFTPLGMQVEWAIAIGGLLVALLLPATARKVLSSAQAAFGRLARRKPAAVLAVGLFPVVVRLALLPVMPIPNPSVHDEFSHLLLGDTLASGRLTNPTHPLWEHFESIHIINQPTYNSMYPPGLGVALAAGQRLAGHPWFGVVAAVGLMCASLCWMLQAWVPPGWAFFGAMMFAMRVGIYGMYMNSYFGGEVPAIGGALVLGALGRIRRLWRPRHAAVLGAGLIVMANSRPWESAWMSVASAVVLLLWFRKSGTVTFRKFAVQSVAPLFAVLVVGGAATAYYCWRVTGSPLRLPYQVNRSTYGWPEHLAILPAATAVHRHKAMHDHYLTEKATREYYRTPMRFVGTWLEKINTAWRLAFGPVLSLPLLALPLIFRDRRVRDLLIFGVIMFFAYVAELFLYPQYVGPIAALLYALWVQSARHIYVCGVKKYPVALHYMRLTPLLCLLLIPERVVAGPLGLAYQWWDDPHWPSRERRAVTAARLEQMPGRQFVIVHYGPQHSSHEEWVYNRAEIDRAKVVWARDMGQDLNRRLVNYFEDRQIWLLEADEKPPLLKPYGLVSATCCASEESTK